MRVDQPCQVVACRTAQFYAGQLGKIVERNCLAGASLLEAEQGTLESTRDAVEEFHHVLGIGICIVERARQKRPGECSFLNMRARCQPGELRGMLAAERDVQPVVIGHSDTVHEKARVV